MTPETTKRLREVSAAGRRIASWAGGRPRDGYLADPLLVAACNYEFVVIGESISRVRSGEPGVLGGVSKWRRIVGFRHQLVHHYDKINDDVTWRIIRTKLPVLLAEVDALLAEADGSAGG